MPISADDIQLTAPAPDPVMGISAQIVGPLGLMTYHYWWVAHYPIGVTVVSAPVTVRNAPDVSTLSATNYVIVAGRPALGATTYDLLRTNSSRLPVSGSANIAVATGLSSPTFLDQGAALTGYNIAGLVAGAPVSEFINLNNRDFAQPTLVFSPWPQAVQGLIFPDGTTQNTAGISAAQIYSWQQDVFANQHQLLNLSNLELASGAFGFNFKTTGVAGAFPAGAFVLTNETTAQVVFAVNQVGDIGVGVQATSNRIARFLVTTTASYGGNGNNPLFYGYNPVSSATMVIEATTNNASYRVQTGLTNFALVSQGTVNQFYIFDQNASPNGYRVIITAGKIGIANGTLFTPAHQLELNVDDAAKPTTNTWTISSDIRTKRNVRPLEGGMSVIDALEPIVAEYNGLASTPEGSRVVSFDPDKLGPILPDAVRIHRSKLQPEDEEETDIKGVNNHEVIFHLVLAVQQLSAKLKELEASI